MAAGGSIRGNTVIFSAAHTWSANQTFNDNVKLILGTDADFGFYSDGTSLIWDTDSTTAITFVDGTWTFAVATSFITSSGDLTFSPSGNNVFTKNFLINDDLVLALGSIGDVVLILRSTTLAADAELVSIIEGTSVHQGVAANSLIISNITDAGDILMLVSDGGNSLEFLLADADVAALSLGHGMATVAIKTASGAITLTPGTRVVNTKITNTDSPGSLTIASGAVAITKSFHTLVVEGGQGSGADSLATATGGVDGDILILKTTTAGGSDQVTISDGTGSDTFILAGGADFIMDHLDDRLMLIHNGTEWVEISRSSNS